MLRRTTLLLLVALVVPGCTGDGEGPGAQQSASSASSEASAASQVTPSEDESPSGGAGSELASEPAASEDGSTVTAKPAADIKGRCTREPQPGELGEELVADLRVVNTGNLGVVVRVATRWPIGVDEGILRWSRLRVEQGETAPLEIRIPVDAEAADGVRKAVKKDRNCRTRFRVTGAFGVPED